MRNLSFLFLVPLAGATLLAQTTTLSTTGSIGATATASISVNPDQVQLTAGVVTLGSTAADAAQQNATLTTAVIAALKQVLGSTGTIQTVSYSVSPRYGNGANQTIIGYTATNTVQVTTSDLSLPGRLIDAANQAGANNVGSLSFSLQNPDPVTQQALTQASKQALAHAAAIASGLGVKTGSVIAAQEGSTVIPYLVSGVGATATSTPVQTGLVTITATVTVNVRISQ